MPARSAHRHGVRADVPRPPRGVLGGLLVLTLALAGCRSGSPAAEPPPPPPSPSQGAVQATRVGVVDLSAVARAHPRWGEVDAVSKQVMEVESRLAQVPVPPATLGGEEIQQALDAEAVQVREAFQQELDALHEDARQKLDADSETLRQEHEAKFAAARAQIEAEAERQLKAKRDALQAQLRAVEQEIHAEYRYPLLNLRLRAEVAGLTSEEEARQVLRELQALQQERGERIAAKADEMDKVFQEFRNAKETEVNEKLKQMQVELNAEGQRRVAARQQELEAELARAAAQREEAFQERMTRRRQELLSAAEAQARQQQGAFRQDVDERTRRLRDELMALQEQRVRLEDSILAEVKIEVAAIAQERQLDVVLTRYIANLSGIDITPDVINKLKR